MTAGGGGGPGGRLLVATRNRGKLRELRAALDGLGYELLDLADAGIAYTAAEEDVESYANFADNALAKARHFSALAGGAATVADDSGLEVTALGGAPGVRSRRYAGAVDASSEEETAANNAKLLGALAGVADRRARFVCALAYVAPGREFVCLGATSGEILQAAAGDGGFGYDPLFASDDLGGRTFGAAPPDEKARVSHRARAAAALRAALADAAR